MIGSLMGELFRSVLKDEGMQAQSDIFSKYYVFDKSSMEDFQNFYVDTFIEYLNNARHWTNCGFTPMEMRNSMEEP